MSQIIRKQSSNNNGKVDDFFRPLKHLSGLIVRVYNSLSTGMPIYKDAVAQQREKRTALQRAPRLLLAFSISFVPAAVIIVYVIKVETCCIDLF